MSILLGCIEIKCFNAHQLKLKSKPQINKHKKINIIFFNIKMGVGVDAITEWFTASRNFKVRLTIYNYVIMLYFKY